jgi:hypothetical protein
LAPTSKTIISHSTFSHNVVHQNTSSIAHDLPPPHHLTNDILIKVTNHQSFTNTSLNPFPWHYAVR